MLQVPSEICVWIKIRPNILIVPTGTTEKVYLVATVFELLGMTFVMIDLQNQAQAKNR